jgi:hypothetical protein
MTITWAYPTDAMIEHVGRRMRAHDAEECRLMSGLFPVDALGVGVAASDVAFCALANREPVAIFGGRNGSALDPSMGMIWELGTEWIDRHPLTFARHSKAALRMFWDGLDVERAGNMVWAENEASRRWLYWLGASFGREVVPGRLGGVFIPFTIEREANHV